MTPQTFEDQDSCRVSAHLECTVSAGTTTIASIALARGHARIAAEELVVTLDGEPIEAVAIHAENGTLLHRITADTAGALVIDYSAEAAHAGLFDVGDTAADDEQLIRYIRPSRYVPSDALLPSAYAHFPAADYPVEDAAGLADAIETWVNSEIAYVSGSSRFTDDARDTYLARRGVCRDFAHLVVSLLRSRNIPARVASVYAPGLTPMDFHLVAEAYLDGAWRVLDATRLAPRHSLMRIATGRDASDTAFLSTISGSLSLKKLTVTAEELGQPVERPDDSKQIPPLDSSTQTEQTESTEIPA